MESPEQALSRLREELVRRTPVIKKTAYLGKLSFGPVQGSSFSAHAWWRDGEMLKQFRYDQYFRQGVSPPRLLAPSYCRVAAQFIHEILEFRGL